MVTWCTLGLGEHGLLLRPPMPTDGCDRGMGALWADGMQLAVFLHAHAAGVGTPWARLQARFADPQVRLLMASMSPPGQRPEHRHFMSLFEHLLMRLHVPSGTSIDDLLTVATDMFQRILYLSELASRRALASAAEPPAESPASSLSLSTAVGALAAGGKRKQRGVGMETPKSGAPRPPTPLTPPAAVHLDTHTRRLVTLACPPQERAQPQPALSPI